MNEKREYFRYQFPAKIGSICTDERGIELTPFDISHGGIGFFSSRQHVVGAVEKIILLEFLSLDIRIKFCSPWENDGSPEPVFKIGGEFVDFVLTPQKLIEFLEIHLTKP